MKPLENQLHVQHKNDQSERLANCGTIRQGMVVVGKNGKDVGSVKDLQDQSFLVDRPLARDIYVPYEACLKIEHDVKIYLTVLADQVDQQGWQEHKIMPDGL